VHFSTDPRQRREFIYCLRQLAAFLDANPAVPVPRHGTTILLHDTGSDAEKLAAVDRIAALLAVTPSRGGHYTATRRFGPIGYEAVAIPAAVWAEDDARRSYEDNITLAPAGPAPVA
jgi:hypothetical protein